MFMVFLSKCLSARRISVADAVCATFIANYTVISMTLLRYAKRLYLLGSKCLCCLCFICLFSYPPYLAIILLNQNFTELLLLLLLLLLLSLLLVRITIRLGVERSEGSVFDSWQGQKVFHFSTAFNPALWPHPASSCPMGNRESKTDGSDTSAED